MQGPTAFFANLTFTIISIIPHDHSFHSLVCLAHEQSIAVLTLVVAYALLFTNLYNAANTMLSYYACIAVFFLLYTDA
jgi:hypothetical protein